MGDEELASALRTPSRGSGGQAGDMEAFTLEEASDREGEVVQKETNCGHSALQK